MPSSFVSDNEEGGAASFLASQLELKAKEDECVELRGAKREYLSVIRDLRELSREQEVKLERYRRKLGNLHAEYQRVCAELDPRADLRASLVAHEADGQRTAELQHDNEVLASEVAALRDRSGDKEEAESAVFGLLGIVRHSHDRVVSTHRRLSRAAAAVAALAPDEGNGGRFALSEEQMTELREHLAEALSYCSGVAGDLSTAGGLEDAAADTDEAVSTNSLAPPRPSAMQFKLQNEQLLLENQVLRNAKDVRVAQQEEIEKLRTQNAALEKAVKRAEGAMTKAMEETDGHLKSLKEEYLAFGERTASHEREISAMREEQDGLLQENNELHRICGELQDLCDAIGTQLGSADPTAGDPNIQSQLAAARREMSTVLRRRQTRLRAEQQTVAGVRRTTDKATSQIGTNGESSNSATATFGVLLQQTMDLKTEIETSRAQQELSTQRERALTDKVASLRAKKRELQESAERSATEHSSISERLQEGEKTNAALTREIEELRQSLLANQEQLLANQEQHEQDKAELRKAQEVAQHAGSLQNQLNLTQFEKTGIQLELRAAVENNDHLLESLEEAYAAVASMELSTRRAPFSRTKGFSASNPNFWNQDGVSKAHATLVGISQAENFSENTHS